MGVCFFFRFSLWQRRYLRELWLFRVRITNRRRSLYNHTNEGCVVVQSFFTDGYRRNRKIAGRVYWTRWQLQTLVSIFKTDMAAKKVDPLLLYAPHLVKSALGIEMYSIFKWVPDHCVIPSSLKSEVNRSKDILSLSRIRRFTAGVFWKMTRWKSLITSFFTVLLLQDNANIIWRY